LNEKTEIVTQNNEGHLEWNGWGHRRGIWVCKSVRYADRVSDRFGGDGGCLLEPLPISRQVTQTSSPHAAAIGGRLFKIVKNEIAISSLNDFEQPKT